MRIGLPGLGRSADHIVEQAERAEADGFSSLWYASATAGDPLVAMAVAGRATSTIELGTAVLQTYPCHPVLQAGRAAAVASAIGGPGRFTLGVGPSHEPVVEGTLGLSYRTPGRHTDEYVQIVSTLLRGQPVSFAGEEFRVNAGPPERIGDAEIPVLLAALGPRLLRVAGQHTAGTITWMANATAIAQYVAPSIRKEARSRAAEQFALYGTLPNYQRILGRGGAAAPADAAIVGNEGRVTAQIEALFEAGATDVWAAPYPVGEDRQASRERTRALLKDLATG
jgi:alkanesulfonate monooxygenase SsuD/methylene tetrahydromethanopterin reductase-like flavin-dependent oxidoreductase (luciferase family)